MKLYSYWRSTTSFRVRAALNLKNLSYDIVSIDLLAGAQHDVAYLRLNPAAGVPTLELEDGTVLSQSLAIIDYLDAIAAPKLLPEDPGDRAKVLCAAHALALDVHPVNNLRVVRHLKHRFNAGEAEILAWMQHWTTEGIGAFEHQIRSDTTYCFGESPDLADLCLAAQVYNARRWHVDLDPFPKIRRVEAACLSHPAIAAAHPDQQPDARVAS